MFNRRTLFILGAGASAEVGLPVGTKLAKSIANLLTITAGSSQNGPGERLLAQLYDKHPISHNGYHRAAQAIRSGVELTNSIDDYLDRHADNELVQRVGKAAIVNAIIDAEHQSDLNYDPKQPPHSLPIAKIENTWFTKFFRMLGSGVNVSNARQIFDSVAFIVFNYDRCLEFFLLNALQLVYGLSHNDAASIVEDCRIIHPYGVVAELPLQASGNPVGVPFGGGPSADDYDYVSLSAGIKIFTEQMAAAEVLSQIHDEMFRAEQIVFLGFGYHDPNMTILTPKTKFPQKPIYGTAKGMSDISIDMVRRQLSGMFSGSSPQITDRTSAALFDYYAKALTI